MDSDTFGLTASEVVVRPVELTGKDKLLGDQWKIIEKSIGSVAIQTLNVLNKTAENLYSAIVTERGNVETAIENQMNIKPDPEYVTIANRYLELRKKIMEDRKLQRYFNLNSLKADSATGASAGSGSGSSLKKSEKIINTNVNKQINEGFEKLMEKLKMNTSLTGSVPTVELLKLQDLIYTSGYVELMVLSFVSASNLVSDTQINTNNTLNNEENKKLYELALGMSHLYDKLNPESKNQIELKKISSIDSNVLSVECLKDLFDAKEKFLKKLKYRPVFLSQNFPQLIFDNPYSNLLNVNSIKPYKSQVQVLAGLIDANNGPTSNGFLCLLKTLTGEGKTSLIVSLANTVSRIRSSRMTRPDYKKMEIIFCCNDRLNTVSYQVGQYAYSMHVPFGMAYEVEKEKDGKKYKTVRVSNNNNCAGTTRILTIADIVSTSRLLEKAVRDEKDYVLFFDEPTSFLDENNPELIEHLSYIFKYLPPNVIFSSATLPKVEQIEPFTKYFKDVYPESKLMIVESSKVKIGCQVNDFQGNLFIPNHGLKNKIKMEMLITKMRETSFIKKLYTPYVTSALWKKIEKLIKETVITLEGVENFKIKFGEPSNFNQEAVQNSALEYLIKIAETNNDDVIKKFNKFTKTVQNKEEPIDFSKLVEYKRTIFPTQTLIVTANPIKFVVDHFGKIFEDIFQKEKETNKKDGKTFDHMYNIYSNYVEQERVFVQKQEELKMGTSRQRMKNESELESFKPIFHFSNNKLLNVNYKPEFIDFTDMSSENNLLLVGLVLGVGIYSPTKTSERYQNEVLNLASEGKLAYIVADTDIAYGTNYAIENIIIDNTCFSGENPHSISTLFQVIARAGRVGKSWRAMIYCDSVIIEMLKSYIQTDDGTNEADKINQAVRKVTPPELKEIREEVAELAHIEETQRTIDTTNRELLKTIAYGLKLEEDARIKQQSNATNTMDTTDGETESKTEDSDSAGPGTGAMAGPGTGAMAGPGTGAMAGPGTGAMAGPGTGATGKLPMPMISATGTSATTKTDPTPSVRTNPDQKPPIPMIEPPITYSSTPTPAPTSAPTSAPTPPRKPLTASSTGIYVPPGARMKK
jgi:hypothetical protein